MFYLGENYGKRTVFYRRPGQFNESSIAFEKRQEFAPGFMVWAGVSARGKTSLIFIDKNTKVNSHVYINKVLKPFLRKDVPRLFPGADKNKMIFHQDSASSHTAKTTLDYLY